MLNARMIGFIRLDIPRTHHASDFFRTTFFVFIIITLSLFSLTATGWAQGETKPGDPKIIIKPMITTSGRLESNFFNTEANEREAYTFLAAPGIQLGAETPKLSVLFNYTLEAYLYEDAEDVPAGEQSVDELDYFGHLATLDAKYNPFRRVTLGLENSYYVTRYPTAYDRLSDSIQKDKYWINRFSPSFFYDFENKFSTGLRYRRTDLNYSESDANDSTEHRGIFNLIYNLNRTSTVDLELQHWTMDYESNPLDYTSDQIKLIFQKRYKYLSFDAGFGFHERDYDDPATPDGDAFAYKVSATWQNPPPPERRRYLGRGFVRPKSHIFLSLDRNFSNYFTDYIAHRLTLDAGHIFKKKIQARIKGYYQLTDYDTSTGLTPAGNLELRDDDTYKISAGLTYFITKKMDLGLTAGRQERDSNLAGGSYNNKFLMLVFNYAFDFRSRGGFTEESLYY